MYKDIFTLLLTNKLLIVNYTVHVLLYANIAHWEKINLEMIQEEYKKHQCFL